MSQDDEFTITIPETLVNKLRNMMKNTDYTSLTSFVINLIRKAISNVGEEMAEEESYTKEEEEKIKDRLRNLGYID